MNSRAVEGRSTPSRRRGILIALAIAGLSATLGLSIPRQAFAKNEPGWRCSRDNSGCLLGGDIYCSATCDSSGCGCSSWSDT
jgi:hypothetical protein